MDRNEQLKTVREQLASADFIEKASQQYADSQERAGCAYYNGLRKGYRDALIFVKVFIEVFEFHETVKQNKQPLKTDTTHEDIHRDS